MVTVIKRKLTLDIVEILCVHALVASVRFIPIFKIHAHYIYLR